MRTIANDVLKVSIDEYGAELNSIVRRDNATEYVWRADPAVWKRHAPLLFPVIGRLKNKEYEIDGKTWSITQHGFGRDLAFEAHPVSNRCVEFVLTDNEYTHSMYPYKFKLTIRYTLSGNTLKKEHIVENLSKLPMYYELGGHDAYATCLTPEEKITDSYVQFEDGIREIHPLVFDENIMLTKEHETVALDDHSRLSIKRDTFIKDALIIDDLKTRRVTVGSKVSDKKIVMEFEDFPYVALWSKYVADQDIPYVCVEPWTSLPDCSYLGKELDKKIGIHCLQPGETETLSFTVSVF